MDAPLSQEIVFLLEALAGGFFPGAACQFCEAPLHTMNAELMANIHLGNCPVLRARKLLAQNGTPVNAWRITYEVRRLDTDRVDTMSQDVIRHELSEEDALDRVMSHIAHYQGKRRLVEGSLHAEELGIVPCE